MVPSSEDIFARNILLYGPKGYERLRQSFVAVVGLGGVGYAAAEALARAGVGKLRLIDCDVVKPSDINRQLIALTTNLNVRKVEAARERLSAINPHLFLDCRHAFFHYDTAAALIGVDIDFVIDAIDSLSPKAELVRHCTERGIRIISALGAAGRTDPSKVNLARLDDTINCPLARALRRQLRKHKACTDIPVVYSSESPVGARGNAPAADADTSGTYVRGRTRRPLPSLSTIPAIVGLTATNYVIMEILKAGTDE